MVFYMPEDRPHPINQFANAFVGALGNYLGQKEQGQRNVKLAEMLGVDNPENFRGLSDREVNFGINQFLRQQDLNREEQFRQQEIARQEALQQQALGLQQQQQQLTGQNLSQLLGLSPEQGAMLGNLPLNMQQYAVNQLNAQQAAQQKAQQRAQAEQQLIQSKQAEVPKELQKLTSEYLTDLSKKADKSLNTVQTTQRLKQLVNQGAVDISDWRGIASYLGFERLDKPETAEFRTLTGQLMSEYKNLFGNQITDADLKFINSRLPEMTKSREANLAILDSFERGAELNLAKNRLANELLSQGVPANEVKKQIDAYFADASTGIISQLKDKLKENEGQAKENLETPPPETRQQMNKRILRQEGLVPMVDPQGREFNVPVADVDYAKSKGFKTL